MVNRPSSARPFSYARPGSAAPRRPVSAGAAGAFDDLEEIVAENLELEVLERP